MNLYISKRSKPIGGGSNTFSHMFCRYAEETGHKVVRDICKAERAIIIAHLGNKKKIAAAKKNNCKIIHRLDEYFEADEDDYRRRKHHEIIEINRMADVTVFQSKFVYENVSPFLSSQNQCIIHNGGDPEMFSYANKPGQYIGHVSWGYGAKKRLDLLHEFIVSNPNEKFLLIGRHSESDFDFNLPNVLIKGPLKRKKLPEYYRKMKMLFFPSEKDPCPNTVIEAILSGVPVCFNPVGGTIELVKDCGESLSNIEELLANLSDYRSRCSARKDLYFNRVFERYLNV